MITITINPIIFTIGHFHLNWYGLIVALALLTGLWLVVNEGQRKGFSKDALFDITPWLMLGGIIGARLFHVADHWDDIFSKEPSRIITLWGGGLAIWGAIAGGFISLYLIAWKNHWNFSRLLDIFAPGVVLGQAIGRFACIITGDSVGKPTDGPFGLAYTNPNAMVPKLGVYYTPTPIYEILLNTAIFTIIWNLRRLRLPNGALFLIYLSLYSTGRFYITFMSNYREFAFGLNQAQVVSLVVLMVSIPILVRMAIVNSRVVQQ